MSTDIRERDRGGTVKERIREALDTIVEKGGADRDGYRGHELTLVTLVESALTEIERLEGAIEDVGTTAGKGLDGNGPLYRSSVHAASYRADLLRQIRRDARRALSDTEEGA